MTRPGLTNDADVRSLASNALLRLFDSLYEGAVVVDRTGRITWINDKYKALLGWIIRHRAAWRARWKE